MNTQLSEPEPQVTIRRVDGSWAIVSGSHVLPLPWKDSASCISVVVWLKSRLGGLVHVMVDLS